MNQNRQRCSRRMMMAAATGILLAWAIRDGRAQPQVHRLYRSDMPPGVIGATQTAPGLERPGYVQPIHVTVPEGAIISFASDRGVAVAAIELRAGLLLG